MSATLTVVPAGSPAGFTPMSFPPANSMRVPSASVSSRVSSSSRETAAMVGNASPRNPSVAIESRSSADLSLLVAWRSNASSASSCDIPWPSSITRIMRLPPTSASTRMVFAPASMAFSSSSFTTEAGRSTTSPAAILFATASGNMRMRLMSLGGFLPFLNSDSELVELILVDGRWRLRHQILGGGGFREGDDFANGFFTGEAEKFPLRFIDHAEGFAKLQTQLSGDERSRFGAFDLFLGGNGDDEIAGFRAASFGELLYVFRADQFFDGGCESFGRGFHKIGAARFEHFCFFRQFVQLLARITCRAGSGEREDIAFDLQLLPGFFREAMRYFVQFHAEAQVGLVAAVFA